MDIRRASEADAETISRLNADIQALHARSLPQNFKPPSAESFPPDKVRTLLGYPQVRIWIAWEAGTGGSRIDGESEAVGYAYAEILRYGESALRHAQEYIYLHHLSVAPAHQRKGVGSALIGKVVELAADEQIASLQLDMWAFNETARAFFARHGFTPLTVRMERTGA